MKKFKFWAIFLIIIFVFWKFLIPGPRVASDFPFASSESVKTGFSLPQTWSRSGENFGSNNISTLWSWPVDFLYGAGVSLGVDFFLLVRIFEIFFMLFLGYFSVGKLLDSLGVKNSGKLVGILFYLLNTFLLILVDGGQLAIALAYSWFPMAYLLVKNSLKEGLGDKLTSGLAISILGFFDIRFVYVLFILLALNFIYESIFLKRKKIFSYLISWLSTALVSGLVFVGLNIYWILPSVLAKAPALPETYQRVTQTAFLSLANLGHSLLLLQPHWYKNVFGKVTPLLSGFVLIPLLVFIAPILRRKSKMVGFWLLVAVTGVFLVKGANPPFLGVYPWLFEKLPGFNLFRDPTKFFFLVALSYAVLIGVTVDEITQRFSGFKIKNNFLKSSQRSWSCFAYILNPKSAVSLLVVYFLFLIRPVWLGQMT